MKEADRLKDFFKENNGVALAFSGGVDSSFLLYAGLNAGAEVVPYYIKTDFQPKFEYEDAMRLAKELGVEVNVIEHDILSAEKVKANPENRCYYCKTELFNLVKARAAADGFNMIIDGSNASDDATDRPGMKALEELQVRSPLRECGLTKDMIRKLSKEAGLFTWNKPAYACLATRIPAGITIDKDMLRRVEMAESELFKFGFKDFRVRIINDAARLQVKEADFLKVAEMKEEIEDKLKPYFKEILLDFKTR